jgi:hypothetical protein
MRNSMQLNSMPSRGTARDLFGRLPGMAVIAAALLGTPMLTAQAGVDPQADTRTHSAAPAHRARHSQARNLVAPTPVQAAPAPAPAPELPKWPVNDTPAQPSVTWDSQGLHIEATNCSLKQILSDVASATGAQVEGMEKDERVFGQYGPGQARDVLSQLLHGSGYNVLMIGDQGQGTPRQIVLSARRAGSAPANAGMQAPASPDAQDDEAPEPPEADEQQPQPNRMPMGQPGVPRTPQQVMQELQQRQIQMMNQQQAPPQQQQQPH